MTNIKDKKIIAFDLDGTLAESKQPLDKEMAVLLKELLKHKKVIIISGGSFSQFEKQFLPYLEITEDEKDLYSNLILLPTSGSLCYQFDVQKKDWQITNKEEMPKEIKEKIFSTIKDFIENNSYGIKPYKEGDQVLEDRGTQITLSALGQNAPIEEKIKWDKDQEKRQAIKKILESKLPEVSFSIGGATSIDVLPKGFDKAEGLKKFLEKEKMKKEDLFFIGDAIFPGGNDYSPLLEGFDCQKVSGPAETKKIIQTFL
ncbi:MAG TPA: HAD-IIB family hydrolase [Candidatus Paceibacterota bacterium]|mgnify:CR=1 FL=1|nr:HAD-IIB family hydrolase [Candidatus Paceibacterota bacterium]